MSDKHSAKYYKLPKDTGPHQGNVKMRITGFHNQSHVQITDIVDAIDLLPDRHLEGLQEIHYDPEKKMGHSIFQLLQTKNKKQKAFFDQRKRSIYIHSFENMPLFLHILFHEIGHHVYYRIIGSKLKKQWVTQIYPNSKHATAYAKCNASEDFAESYAVYVLNPKKLIVIPEKYYFMQNQVFNGFKTKKPKTIDLRT